MRYNVGVDLGGTNIAAGVVSEDGKLLSQADIPTGVERGFEAVVADMGKVVKMAIEKSGIPESEIESIGIGVPGTADSKSGMVVFCTNLFWHDVPLAAELQKYINKPVFMDNDANVAALAESAYGCCKGYDSSIVVTLGTGVGGGIILYGKPWGGVHNVGAEIGHMVIVKDGIQCTCGRKGCWERYASATALIREGKAAAEANHESLIYKTVNGDLDKINAKVVVDAAKAGDADGLRVFNEYVDYVVCGTVSLINLFDPSVIAYGGGVARAGQFLLDAIKDKVAAERMYKSTPFAELKLCSLGNEAGILGAAMLGFL